MTAYNNQQLRRSRRMQTDDRSCTVCAVNVVENKHHLSVGFSLAFAILQIMYCRLTTVHINKFSTSTKTAKPSLLQTKNLKDIMNNMPNWQQNKEEKQLLHLLRNYVAESICQYAVHHRQFSQILHVLLLLYILMLIFFLCSICCLLLYRVIFLFC